MERVSLFRCNVDFGSGSVEGGGETRRLTGRELGLLRYLAERPHQVVPREELLVEVFGYAATVVSRAVDKTMVTLRKKVELEPWAPDHLLAVRGQGYRFVPRPEPELPEMRTDDRWVGQEDVVSSLVALVKQTPLVVITGPAGVGKSRAARELVLRLVDYRAVTVSVLDARGVRDIVQRVARAAGIPLGTAEVAALGQALALEPSPRLLVIDEAEPVTQAVAEVVAGLRSVASNLRVVVTSRRVLGLRDEHVVRLSPLPPADAVSLLQHHAARQGWTTVGADDEVLGLVERLDRLPLAIELVAPWLGVFELSELSRRIKAGAGPLSLDDVLERSFALLDPVERLALTELSVFEEGFDLPLAEAVLSPPADGRPVVHVLQSLAQASMIQRTPIKGRPRLTLLHSVRRRAGFEDANLRSAHATALARFGQLPERKAHLTETANLIAACRAATELAMPDVAVGCLEGVRRAAQLGGFVEVVLPLADAVLALDNLAPNDRARAILCRCQARFDLDRTGMDAELAEVSQLAQEPDVRALGVYCRAGQLAAQGEGEIATSMLTEALRDALSARLQGVIQLSLATRARKRGNFDEARRVAAGAVRVLEGAGEVYKAAHAHLELGIQYVQSGEPGLATHHNEQARTGLIEVGARPDLALLLANVAAAYRVEGKAADAVAAYAEGADAHRALGEAGGLASCLIAASDLLLELEDAPEARIRLTEARALTATGPLAITRAVGNLLYGKLRLQEGAPTEALSLLRKGVDELGQLGSAYLHIKAYCELAAALRSVDEDPEADEMVEAARRLAQERGLLGNSRIRDAIARVGRDA
ncbi:MAG: winged helix-turn-helix domain-containing protein [Myxococcota bacterium]